MSDTLLVIAAHPDDEILGVGGTVAKRVLAGDVAHVLILGEGQTSRFDKRDDAPQDLVDDLRADTNKVAEIIGFSSVEFGSLPDNRFDQKDLLDIVKIVEKVIEQVKPSVIYTHDSGDLNIDHRITFEAVLTATRPIGEDCVRELYTFETLSASEWSFGNYGDRGGFNANVYIDISSTIETKLNAMRGYETELRDYPHPRSLQGITALAQSRGIIAGVDYAEALRLIRAVYR